VFQFIFMNWILTQLALACFIGGFSVCVIGCFPSHILLETLGNFSWHRYSDTFSVTQPTV